MPTSSPALGQTIGDVMDRLYRCISGPPGTKRDWETMQALFVPGARMLPLFPSADGSFAGRSFTAPEYEATRDDFFRTNGFHEFETQRVEDVRGPLANVHSWFTGRYEPEGADLVRGVNAVQLVRMQERWWITAISWYNEYDARPPRSAGHFEPTIPTTRTSLAADGPVPET